MDAQQYGVGIVPFLQQADAFNGVRIVDNRAVSAVRGSANLAETNLGTLGYGGDVLDLDSSAVGILDDRILDVLDAGEKAD